MVIDGRGYDRALGPMHTARPGNMLAPQHQLGTAIPPTVQTVWSRICSEAVGSPIGTSLGGERSLSEILVNSSFKAVDMAAGVGESCRHPPLGG